MYKLIVTTTNTNYFFTVTNIKNNILFNLSSGKLKFKKAQRDKATAALELGDFLVKKLKALRITTLQQIKITGKPFKLFHKALFLKLQAARIVCKNLEYNFPIAFNGCRSKKMRRTRRNRRQTPQKWQRRVFGKIYTKKSHTKQLDKIIFV